MIKLLLIIKSIKKLRKIEPNKTWLRAQRSHFVDLTNIREIESRPSLLPKMKLVTSFLAAMLIIGLVGGLTQSAQAALPSDTLYPIKLLSERFQSFLIFGDENKINFILKLAERRLEEVESQTENNSSIAASSTDQNIEYNIEYNVGEEIIVGTIFRAQSNLEKAEGLLKKISYQKKDFKNFEKVLDRLERVAERKNHLRKKLGKKAPGIIAALRAIDSASVSIEEEANKIIITFNFEEDDDNEEINNASSANNHATTTVKNKGVQRILTLLTDGAGKSGKVPPGLLKARGIHKKLGDLFDFDDHDDDEDDDDESDTTPPAISSISVTGISSTSATINWVTDELADSLVNFGSDINYGNATSSSSLATSHSIMLANLTASSTIHFQVQSVDEAGNVATSSDQFFTTLPEVDAVAPVLSSISAVNVASTSVTIQWTTDEPATSKVYYASTSPVDFSSASNKATSSFVSSHSLDLTNLTASSTYHFVVESADGAGNIATSTESSFQTLSL